jgi:hypothetical protein
VEPAILVDSDLLEQMATTATWPNRTTRCDEARSGQSGKAMRPSCGEGRTVVPVDQRLQAHQVVPIWCCSGA